MHAVTRLWYPCCKKDLLASLALAASIIMCLGTKVKKLTAAVCSLDFMEETRNGTQLTAVVCSLDFMEETRNGTQRRYSNSASPRGQEGRSTRHSALERRFWCRPFIVMQVDEQIFRRIQTSSKFYCQALQSILNYNSKLSILNWQHVVPRPLRPHLPTRRRRPHQD